MKATIKPLFPRAQSKPTGDSIVWPSLFAHMSRVLRHRIWSGRVFVKHSVVRRDARWYPQNLIQLFGRRKLIAVSRILAPRLQFYVNKSIQNILPPNFSFRERLIERERIAFSHSPTSTDLSPGNMATIQPYWRTKLLEDKPQDARLRFTATASVAHLQKRIPSRALIQSLLDPESILARTLHPRRQPRQSEPSTWETGRRIEQKLRRVEDRLVPVQRDLLKSAATESPTNGWSARTRAAEPPEWAEGRGKVMSASAPEFDVKKVADEVMQQIDRRIVAAQERFGKI